MPEGAVRVLLLLAVLLGLPGCGEQLSAGLLQIRQAESLSIRHAAAGTRPAASGNERQAVGLPLVRDIGLAGRLSHVRLELDLTPYLHAGDMAGAGAQGGEGAPAKSLLFTQAVNGMDVYLNGVWVGGLPQSTQTDRYMWYRPLRVPLPRNLLRADGPNVVLLEISTLEPRIVISPVYVGSVSDVVKVNAIITFVGTSLADSAGLFCLVVGLFMLGAWLVSPRDPTFRFATLTSFVLALLFLLATCIYLPASYYHAWRWATYVLSGMAAWLVGCFVLSLIDEPFSRSANGWALGALLFAALAYPALGDRAQPVLDVYWMPLAFLVYVYACVRLTCKVARQPEPLRVLLLVNCLLSLICGARDYFVMSHAIPPWAVNGIWRPLDIASEPVYLSQLAMPLLLVVMAMSLIQRFRQTAQQAQRTNVDLRRMLRQRERELKVAYNAQLQGRSTELARVERDRIYRDLHDSVGARLVTLLFCVSKGVPDVLRLEHGLKGALKDIQKIISVDAQREVRSIQEVVFEYCTLLEDALAGTGLALHYAIHDGQDVVLLADVPGQTLRILEELVSNAIKHTHAERIEIRLEITDTSLGLSVRDSGGGARAAADSAGGGTGMRGIRERAARIGATYSFERLASGSLARLDVPLVMPASAGHASPAGVRAPGRRAGPA
ncbi:MAG: hypothetical protein REI09_15465, partial [Candidatus Dactylopiibacterium sp.]|nr:hypothetical protein [Candidatus Dactylopiibacterium sp.]